MKGTSAKFSKKSQEKIEGIANIIMAFVSEINSIDDILSKLYSESFESECEEEEIPSYTDVSNEIKKIIKQNSSKPTDQEHQNFDSNIEITLPNGDIIKAGVGKISNILEIERELFGRDYLHDTDSYI